MDFLELVKSRYSVRSYLPRPVGHDKLDRLLEAVRLAPSGSNRQPWKFVVVRDPDVRRRLVAACAGQKFIAQAPVVIAGVGLMPDRVMSCDIPGDPVDVAIAMSHLMLAAVAEGLGTCWIGAFSQGRVREVLGVPGSAAVIGLMTLGYPADNPPPKNRKLRGGGTVGAPSLHHLDRRFDRDPGLGGCDRLGDGRRRSRLRLGRGLRGVADPGWCRPSPVPHLHRVFDRHLPSGRVVKRRPVHRR